MYVKKFIKITDVAETKRVINKASGKHHFSGNECFWDITCLSRPEENMQSYKQSLLVVFVVVMFSFCITSVRFWKHTNATPAPSGCFLYSNSSLIYYSEINLARKELYPPSIFFCTDILLPFLLHIFKKYLFYPFEFS